MEQSADPVGHVVVPYDASNSSVRTRALHWIDRLTADGTLPTDAVTVHGPGFERAALPSGSKVLLVRNAHRFTRGGHEQRLMRAADLGVYDLDDGLPWDDGTLPGLGRWWKRPWPRSLLAQRAADECDRMIVGNDVLAEWAADHCTDVRVIPTCVEPSEYRRRADWAIEGDAPLIGWIGSPATTGYLADIAEAIREVHRRTGARFEAIGADTAALAPVADIVTMRPWHATDSLQRIAAWDVGIMPLRDGVYERAKCGYKLLQYAAAGVPAMASPVGINAMLLDSMEGLAATSTSEWVDGLCQVLGESSTCRATRATAGFAVAEAHSYDRWQQEWVNATGWLEA